MCLFRGQPSNRYWPLVFLFPFSIGIARLIGEDELLEDFFAGTLSNFCSGLTGKAFMIMGCSCGSIVSLMTSDAGLANVTGIFRWTKRLHVVSSCFESSQ